MIRLPSPKTKHSVSKPIDLGEKKKIEAAAKRAANRAKEGTK